MKKMDKKKRLVAANSHLLGMGSGVRYQNRLRAATGQTLEVGEGERGDMGG